MGAGPLAWFTIAVGMAPLERAGFVTIEAGTIPVIVSAPHGGSLRIPGVPDRVGGGAVKQFVTVRDTNTREFAQAFAAQLEREFGGKPFVVVAHFDRKQIDANRPAADATEDPRARPYYDAYHAALKSHTEAVRKNWGRGLLLDLHGHAADAKTTFRGTGKKQSVQSLLDRYGEKALSGPNSLLGALSAKGHTVFPPLSEPETPENPRFNGGHIVRTYGSGAGTGIDAIQLELGGDARARRAIPAFARDLAQATRAFAKEYLPAEPLPLHAQPRQRPVPAPGEPKP